VALENRQGILSIHLDCLCEKTPIVLSACCNAYSPLRQPAMDEVDHHTLIRELYFELLCMSYLAVCEFLFTWSLCEGPIPHPMCTYYQSPNHYSPCSFVWIYIHLFLAYSPLQL
jgi:hypothetical protein